MLSWYAVPVGDLRSQASSCSWWLLLVHQAQPIELHSLIVTIQSCPSKVTELWRFNTMIYATELSSGQMQCEDWQRAIHEKFQYASLAEQSHMATLVTRFLARVRHKAWETPHEYCTPTAVFSWELQTQKAGTIAPVGRSYPLSWQLTKEHQGSQAWAPSWGTRHIPWSGEGL